MLQLQRKEIKNYGLTLCSIFSHVGHNGWLAGSSDTFFKLDTLMMNVAKLIKRVSVVSEEKIFVKVNDDQ